MDPPISGDRAGRMVKERDVVCHRLDGLSMLIGMLQDLVACDDATLDFIKDHMPSELDQGPAFVARNGPGMRLKEAEHLLVGGDFLALEHPAARLRDYLLHQRKDLLGLGAQARGLSL